MLNGSRHFAIHLSRVSIHCLHRMTQTEYRIMTLSVFTRFDLFSSETFILIAFFRPTLTNISQWAWRESDITPHRCNASNNESQQSLQRFANTGIWQMASCQFSCWTYSPLTTNPMQLQRFVKQLKMPIIISLKSINMMVGIALSAMVLHRLA